MKGARQIHVIILKKYLQPCQSSFFTFCKVKFLLTYRNVNIFQSWGAKKEETEYNMDMDGMKTKKIYKQKKNSVLQTLRFLPF